MTVDLGDIHWRNREMDEWNYHLHDKEEIRHNLSYLFTPEYPEDEAPELITDNFYRYALYSNFVESRNNYEQVIYCIHTFCCKIQSKQQWRDEDLFPAHLEKRYSDSDDNDLFVLSFSQGFDDEQIFDDDFFLVDFEYFNQHQRQYFNDIAVENRCYGFDSFVKKHESVVIQKDLPTLSSKKRASL